MTLEESAVIALGLAGGYWAVSLVLRPRPPGRAEEATWHRVLDLPEEAPWHRVLDLPEDAPLADIEAAYRRRAADYAPEKVETLGAELRELAAKKSAQVELAYQRARASRGGAP